MLHGAAVGKRRGNVQLRAVARAPFSLCCHLQVRNFTKLEHGPLCCCAKLIRYNLFYSALINKLVVAAAAAKSLQSCLILCDPIDGSPLGSPVPGILQARTLDWVAISFSNAWKWKVKGKSLSHVRLFATPWTAAYQALPSMGFSRQEYWSGVPLPSLLDGLKTYKYLDICMVCGPPFLLFFLSPKIRRYNPKNNNPVIKI